MAVKGDDNVIYANFGTRKRVSTPAEVNHVDRSGRILSTTASRIAAGLPAAVSMPRADTS